MGEEIKAALRAAAEAVGAELERQEMSGDHDEPEADQWVAAAAIAKFLHLAADVHAGCYAGMEPREALKALAAAVEEAGRE